MPENIDSGMENKNSAMENKKPTLLQITRVFTRYANTTVGGGNATVAVIHSEILDKRRWLNQDEFMLCFALARLTPGTNFLAFCAGIGWLLRRLPGAVVALLASSVPCSIFIVVATALFNHWQNNGWVQSAIHGAIAAAIAITVKACWTIVSPHFTGKARLQMVSIAVAAFSSYVWLSVPAIEVLLFAALVGAVLPQSRS